MENLEKLQKKMPDEPANEDIRGEEEYWKPLPLPYIPYTRQTRETKIQVDDQGNGGPLGTP